MTPTIPNSFVVAGRIEELLDRTEMACADNETALYYIGRLHEQMKDLERGMLDMQRQVTHAQLKASVEMVEKKSDDARAWIAVTTQLPPDDVVVETKIDDAVGGVRNRASLSRLGGLWFVRDRSSYVYYEPTHWRYVEKEPAPDEDRPWIAVKDQLPHDHVPVEVMTDGSYAATKYRAGGMWRAYSHQEPTHWRYIDKKPTPDENRPWIAVTDEMPPDGYMIETKVDGVPAVGVRTLYYERGAWWTDASCTFWTSARPTHWRYKAVAK